MASVQLRDVRLQRGDKAVFNKLNWIVQDGEKRVALIGRNGAGKSSMCRLLNGMLLPDSGQVLVNGQTPKRRSGDTLKRVGYLFQNPEHQLICPTVAEEIAFSPLQFGCSKAAAHARAFELLSQHGIQEWCDWPLAQLSHGQQKVVCLLAVLVNQPDILVLDEPFAGMDLLSTNSFQQTLDSVTQLQIIISHQFDVVRSCERACWLSDGRVVEDGTPEKVIARYRAASQVPTELTLC